MSKTKKKKRKRSKVSSYRKKRKPNKNLSGIEIATGTNIPEPVREAVRVGCIMLSGFAASWIGAGMDKYSLVAGVPLAAYGIHKRNPLLSSIGMGLILSNGYQTLPSFTASNPDLQGIDSSNLVQGAKNRMSAYWTNFSGKFKLLKSQSETAPNVVSGLNGSTSYFINPFSQPQAINPPLDFSAIDRINADIKAQNQMQPKPQLQGMELDHDYITSRNF
jgi:hypothetical protein